MKKNRLFDLLEELQKEIRELKEENREALLRLEELESHVETSLEQLSEPSRGAFDHQSLQERLSAAVESFEKAHPKMTGIISDILAALSINRA